jgi:hypothetical protein
MIPAEKISERQILEVKLKKLLLRLSRRQDSDFGHKANLIKRIEAVKAKLNGAIAKEKA